MRLVTGFPILLTASLVVGCNDGSGDGTGSSLNYPPIADAGADIKQPGDSSVTLDGRASYDPEGEQLTYHWAFDHVPESSALDEYQGSPFIPNHDDTGVTTFRPDAVGTYIAKLVVSDGVKNSDPALVIITIEDPETLPIAEAGIDQTVELGSTVTLNGSGSSDPLNGELSYTWTLVVPYNSALGSSNLTGADSVTASFVPDVMGTYTATLTVANSMASSLPDSVRIKVTGDNEQPVADAGADQTGEDCTSIALDCSDSTDAEGAKLKYFWELQSKPTGSSASNTNFADRTSGTTSFWPDVAGSYSISCSVFDGESWSDPDVLTLELDERATNTAPTVDAGSDRIEAAGSAACELDGYVYDCESCSTLRVELGTDGSITDADSDPLVIEWTVVDGSATLIDDDEAMVDVVLGATQPEEPGACTETAFTFQVAATDCPGSTTTDEVVISAECCGYEDSGDSR